jgi:hypothetical protein
MASRTTQVFAQTLSQANPKPRITQVFAQVLSGAAPKPRVTAVFAQALSLDAGAPPAGPARRRQMYVAG